MTGVVVTDEALAAERGFHEVYLNAQVSAAGFYERLGFQRMPESDREPPPGIVLQVWRRETSPPA